jgi:hypothetical protein
MVSRSRGMLIREKTYYTSVTMSAQIPSVADTTEEVEL